MNCENVIQSLGFRCQAVSDDVLYVESPLTMVFDGSMVGAYIQDIGRGRIRISDNADTMFTAMCWGMNPHPKTSKKISRLATESGISLSDRGELYVTGNEEATAFLLASFIEASVRIGHVFNQTKPIPTSKFERKIAKVVKSHFGDRMKRNATIMGASGHQLTFPFALDFGSQRQQVIQTVPILGSGNQNWRSIYQTVGKMADLKNSSIQCRRVVILEPSPDATETDKARNALVEFASVISYQSAEQIQRSLAA